MPLGLTNDDDDAAARVRASLYTLLGQLLAKPPSRDLLGRVAGLQGGCTALGREIAGLADLAAATDADAAEREYNALFIGVERGELVPYASFYLTGFLHERPLARLRRDMRALGLERQPGVAEPEDHIATLCEIMAGLAGGDFAVQPALSEQRFFACHLAPWAGRFFRDLERSQSARLYRPVGRIGRLFVDFEAECLGERSIA
jgi:TorA maturation chaperone TorD